MGRRVDRQFVPTVFRSCISAVCGCHCRPIRDAVSACGIPQQKPVFAHEIPQVRAHGLSHRDGERTLGAPIGTTGSAVSVVAPGRTAVSRMSGSGGLAQLTMIDDAVGATAWVFCRSLS